jgi:DNA helicase IV
MILNNVLNQELKKEFDLTLVDEVQDFSQKEWDIVNKISSRVLALGDFNQGVYKTDLSREHIIQRGFSDRLTKIFRFHKNIAKLAQGFSRTNADLESMVAKDSKTQPQLIDIKFNERFQKITEIIKQIKVYRERIGIISADRIELTRLSEYLTSVKVDHHFYDSNVDLRSHDFSSTDPLLISSFSAKGLEFEHVILFGFEENSEKIYDLMKNDKLRDVIYVSITRTNMYLYIIRTPETVKELNELVISSSSTNNLESIDDLF